MSLKDVKCCATWFYGCLLADVSYCGYFQALLKEHILVICQNPWNMLFTKKQFVSFYFGEMVTLFLL